MIQTRIRLSLINYQFVWTLESLESSAITKKSAAIYQFETRAHFFRTRPSHNRVTSHERSFPILTFSCGHRKKLKTRGPPSSPTLRYRFRRSRLSRVWAETVSESDSETSILNISRYCNSCRNDGVIPVTFFNLCGEKCMNRWCYVCVCCCCRARAFRRFLCYFRFVCGLVCDSSVNIDLVTREPFRNRRLTRVTVSNF